MLCYYALEESSFQFLFGWMWLLVDLCHIMLEYDQDGVLITERRNRQKVPSLTQKLYPVHNYSHEKKNKKTLK